MPTPELGDEEFFDGIAAGQAGVLTIMAANILEPLYYG
jgi:hypothetical protein